MPITVQVTTDLGRLATRLRALGQSGVRRAAAEALTVAARAAEREVRDSLPRIFDRPNPFTLAGPGSQAANPSTLTARVYIRDAQARYLGLQVTGGIRTPEAGRRALVLPIAAGLDSYGNLPRGTVRSLNARRDVFFGTINGRYGAWQRTARGRLKLLVAFPKRERYRARFPFSTMVSSAARTAFAPAFRRALAAARK